MLRLALLAQHRSVLAATLPLAGWAVHSGVLTHHLRAARRDPLTGLPTREGFERAARRLLHKPDAVVAVVDLDGFKAVNDTHGHAAGDAALVALAEKLRRFAGPNGIAARLGGDEFAAIRPIPAKSIRFTMGRQFAYPPHAALSDGTDLTVRASVGLARVADLPHPSLTAALAAADAAMYAAKRGGGATWILATAEHHTPTAPHRWRRTHPAPLPGGPR
jgi:diguanylate cyclase (GGDEF)-like protein